MRKELLRAGAARIRARVVAAAPSSVAPSSVAPNSLAAAVAAPAPSVAVSEPAHHDLPHSFAVDGGVAWIEGVTGRPLPLVRVRGWSSGTLPALRLQTSAGVIGPVFVSRERRPDVAAAVPGTAEWCGYVAEFHLGGSKPVAVLTGDGVVAVPDADAYGAFEPPYVGLLDDTRVLGREHIYGNGPPTDTHPEILALMATVSGRVLDFGCGNGDLVAWLRDRGVDARGLELDSERINLGLKPEVEQYVTLYDGAMPLPFPDGSFDYVIATEVLEHIPGVASMVSELARVLAPGGHLLVTVPDASSIPKSSPAGMVPWHLLELTHVNFFTHASLAACLAPSFDVEEYYGLLRLEINGHEVPGSIGALLKKRESAAA